jgi:hypothetical protein
MEPCPVSTDEKGWHGVYLREVEKFIREKGKRQTK